jgi:hypothetical protein
MSRRGPAPPLAATAGLVALLSMAGSSGANVPPRAEEGHVVIQAGAPEPTPELRTGGSDGGVDAQLTSIARRLDRLNLKIREHERVRTRMTRWWRCIHYLPTDQAGDPEHGWGFEYDERDGSGIDVRTALVRHTGTKRPDLVLLRFGRARGCTSRAPDPNGTGEDARAHGAAAVAGNATPPLRGSRTSLGQLEHRTDALVRRIGRVEDAFDRFDEWESCLSWLPVTEYGQEAQDLGYLVDAAGDAVRHLPAIDIDGSEWDDPDYELLALKGRDRPFHRRECGHEPGESVDRVSTSPPSTREHARSHAPVRRESGGRLEDLRDEVGAAAEDLEDLVEPVQEFVQFDECMFTVGARSLGGPDGGYRYRTPQGQAVRRGALSFDMGAQRLPQMDLMGFPGEEPPQIECNEDAGGQDTDE